MKYTCTYIWGGVGVAVGVAVGGGGGAGTFWLIKTSLHKKATLLYLLGDTSEQVFVFVSPLSLDN